MIHCLFLLNIIFFLLNFTEKKILYCSATSEKLRVLPNLYVMAAQLLARNERYTELALFIINKVISINFYPVGVTCQG